ncbi:acyl-CoA synthetase (AMP-forming)/AMP-acid ligase II [Paucimonas lemoignei]|uniref:Acyl-CoA synthetase (AMP-forming)/AMP-acid ligase II n=1 Tax=Paucimonas lemoignei TaxID=29443 RepID=A0A4R3I180_PAULE|nr:AMP-binding protein [Paucimonas lemoignei]TCS38345.1 acyl-CoA synthetase (AMP-forming)/AMP-acid ligase II [Paucimonas lemoignei]
MNLSHLFQRSVQLYAQRPALAKGTEPALTYSELNQRVRSLAYWLRHTLGLQAGDRIMLAMKNCPEYMELMLASWHAGLAVVPVNSKLHPNEIDYMLRDSGARACMSQGELFQALQPVAAQIVDLQLVDVASEAYRLAMNNPPLPPVSDSDRDLAWLFYTSGTTGRPKGVMLSHANMVSAAMHFYSDVQTIASDDVLVHVAPMSHGSGIYSLPYFIKGALQVVPESGGLDEAELFGLFNHYDKVSLFAAPTIVHRLVQYAQNNPVSSPGLRALLVGGAPFYVEDIKAAVQCFGPRIAQMYGQGETPMTISALPAEHLARAVAENDTAMLASVGFVQTAIHVSIMDGDNKPVAPGVAGEVVVRGPTVMSGYWNNPEATQKTVVDGALRTGDIGLLDERGLLYLKDRSKDVIISGGSNIYPREVEEALLTHAAVAEVSVVSAPDPEWGEVVVAFVVCHAGATVTAEELDDHCIQSIARFKRPKRYVFVPEFPKNSTGKVLKRELQKSIAAT